jgi:hypothetical protein
MPKGTRSHSSYAKWELELGSHGASLTANFSDDYHYINALAHLGRSNLRWSENQSGYIRFGDIHDIGRLLEKKKNSDITIRVTKAAPELLADSEGRALFQKQEGAPKALHAFTWQTLDGPGGQQLLFGNGSMFTLHSTDPTEAASALRELASRQLITEAEAASTFFKAMERTTKGEGFALELKLPEAASARVRDLVEHHRPMSAGLVLPAALAHQPQTPFADLLTEHLLVGSGIARRNGASVWPSHSIVKIGREVMSELSPLSQAALAAEPREGPGPGRPSRPR